MFSYINGTNITGERIKKCSESRRFYAADTKFGYSCYSNTHWRKSRGMGVCIPPLLTEGGGMACTNIPPTFFRGNSFQNIKITRKLQFLDYKMSKVFKLARSARSHSYLCCIDVGVRTVVRRSIAIFYSHVVYKENCWVRGMHASLLIEKKAYTNISHPHFLRNGRFCTVKCKNCQARSLAL